MEPVAPAPEPFPAPSPVPPSVPVPVPAQVPPAVPFAVPALAPVPVSPRAADVASAFPRQRHGPNLPDRSLVGGVLPAAILDGLAAGLADEVHADRPRAVRSRPGVIAVAGSVVVLAVLLTSMTLAGLLL